jgi:hypothetical protein
MSEEKRKHLRLPIESTIFIELVSPDLEGEDPGEIAECRTLDVSRGGLRVSLARELQVGAILQIGVDLPEAKETLYLAGEVRWCRELPGEETQRWSVGFQLLNAGNSDIASWVGLLGELDS